MIGKKIGKALAPVVVAGAVLGALTSPASADEGQLVLYNGTNHYIQAEPGCVPLDTAITNVTYGNNRSAFRVRVYQTQSCTGSHKAEFGPWESRSVPNVNAVSVRFFETRA
ncbi:hypothetical protein AGRA3207_007854 (plasmid) [Actinomadura graeca]|uniref:Uncharacterized protein n=1 Tax=Actinomadura graeca TaxID=2750812 RepID=A0ABX8RBB5_9ACTN|nr:hypothetical protein [Actinomadura graeca]QXJ27057.1 hypothetical protein AGRA3207_007854 [Actinomadura graeca]